MKRRGLAFFPRALLPVLSFRSAVFVSPDLGERKLAGGNTRLCFSYLRSTLHCMQGKRRVSTRKPKFENHMIRENTGTNHMIRENNGTNHMISASVFANFS